MNSYTNIDEYMQNFPQTIQAILQDIRNTIKAYVPAATEAISYGIPTFKLNKKNFMHFAAYEHHIGIYPGAAIVAQFKRKHPEYSTSKGTIQFPLDKPFPMSIFEEILDMATKNE